jgi:pyrroline-5-carboxylate reductase
MISSQVNSGSEKDGDAVAFLGTGRMASALITSFLHRKVWSPKAVIATHHDKERAADLQSTLGVEVIPSNKEAILRARIVILCVRPLQLRTLLTEIEPVVCARHTVVSVVVGVPLNWIRQFLPTAGAVVHVHPTSLVMASAPGISYVACENDTQSPNVREVFDIFQALGRADFIPERELDALTVAAGCSPAFWARLGSLWCETMERHGIPKARGIDILSATLQGVSHGLRDEGILPEDMVSRIATPQGVTGRGLDVLQHEGVGRILDCVADSCMAKIEEIRLTVCGPRQDGT